MNKQPTKNDGAVRKALAATQYREASVRADDVSQEGRTVDIAFSSATPITRNTWFGNYVEVLDHGADNIRLERMNDGASLLMDHNPQDQIGVVEQASTDGSTGRAVVRFGHSERAEEIFRDVLDGIRTKISVGYRVYGHEEIEGSDSKLDEVRITDWEPLEVSFVAVPADASVGVGREYQINEEQEMATEKEPTEQSAADDSAGIRVTDNTVTVVVEEPEIGGLKAADQKRNEEVAEMVAVGEKFDCVELARETIELGGSIQDLQTQILNKRNNVVPIKQRDSTPYVDMQIPYGRPLRGFRNEEQAYRAGMWARATLFQDQRAQRWCRDYGVRVMTESVFTAGGAIVPTEMSSAIIDLREQYGVMRGLVRTVEMGSDTMTVPRRTGGVTAYAVSEEDAITASDKSWDDVNLVARKYGCLTRFSRDYAEDAVIDVAGDIAEEHGYAFAEKEDDCAINGDGSSAYHGIRGFRDRLKTSEGLAGSIEATAADNTWALYVSDDLDVLRGTLPQYAAQRAPGAIWLCSKIAKNITLDGITLAAGGNTKVDWASGMADAYLGDRIVVSQKMPTVTTALNEVVVFLYGNFQLAATIGSRRDFRMQVLNERYAEYDQLAVVSTTRFDVVVHDVGDGTNAGPVVALTGNTS